MATFGATIWRSPLRAMVAGALLSGAIASILYGFNWHSFYDPRRYMAMNEAEQIAADIADLARLSGAGPESDDRLREALGLFLARRQARITVLRGDPLAPAWQLDNHAALDVARTRLDERFPLLEGVPESEQLTVLYAEAIRPKLATALMRAWTFSLSDYRADPERWWDERLYNRSAPLYGYLLTITLVGFGTIRALYRDQQELGRLTDEADRIADELGELRERRAAETKALRGQLDESERQRSEALRERERINTEIERVEQEYGEVRDRHALSDEVRDERLRGIGERKAKIERELASHDSKMARYESELTSVRGELNAAEELLAEVDNRHDDLMKRLRDRNRRIRQLQELVSQAQREAHSMQIDAVRSGDAAATAGSAASIIDELEEQLAPWLKTHEHASVNFSQHSKSHLVEEQFERIDRDFIDRHFSHVGNREYERGQRKTIRIVTTAGEEDQDSRHAELIVALDDEAGRTLGLRFEVRKSAPDVQHVGFVLALLLRARCRDFKSFAVVSR